MEFKRPTLGLFCRISGLGLFCQVETARNRAMAATLKSFYLGNARLRFDNALPINGGWWCRCLYAVGLCGVAWSRRGGRARH
jgi:hypothetical protein